MELHIYIELAGKEYFVGSIFGNNAGDAKFFYDEKYMKTKECMPISVNLPFRKSEFTAEETKCYFEGLLPEGFTRKTVAQWIHADENDYLKILAALGKECLGALRVVDANDDQEIQANYEKISIEEVKALAREGASKSAELITKAHLSLTGASGKVGLYYDSLNDEWYLPEGTAASTHIVKQSHVRLDGIVTNEQLSILTAKELGIEVPESFIINTGNHTDSEILFATKRYDRVILEDCSEVNKMKIPCRMHQEDFAQALGISSANKYEKPGENHMIRAFDLIRNYSVNPIEDQMKLWKIIVFNYLIGNTDGHLKNFSLLYESHGKGIHLAPAYDLISTTVYESSTRDMAFRIGGVHNIDAIKRATFLTAASEVGIGSGLAIKTFDTIAGKFENALGRSAIKLYEAGFENAMRFKEQILKTSGYKYV